MGALVSRRHQAEVLAHIGRARDSATRVACGGDVPCDERLANGCFFNPTVVTYVSPYMPVWRDEIFGPVLGIRKVAVLAKTVAAVNDSDYGLAAPLFTRDLRSAYRFLDSVDEGQVAINLPTSRWDVHQPFGGFKESVSAFKEQGLEALWFYTRTRWPPFASIGSPGRQRSAVPSP